MIGRAHACATPKLFDTTPSSGLICGEQSNPVAKMTLAENLQHYYFLATGLFCSPQAHPLQFQ